MFSLSLSNTQHTHSFQPFMVRNKEKMEVLKASTLTSVVSSFTPMVEARVGGSLPVSSLAMNGALLAVNRDMTFELEKCLGGIMAPVDMEALLTELHRRTTTAAKTLQHDNQSKLEEAVMASKARAVGSLQRGVDALERASDAG